MENLQNAVWNFAARKMLVIDDEEISRYLVRSVLGQTNVRIIEAATGRDGLQKARDEQPAMIILDLSMPDSSGFEVLRKLKEDPLTSAIPVIIHTSKVLDDHERELLSDAVMIISKESESRELLMQTFTEAFNRAGVSLITKPAIEAQHV